MATIPLSALRLRGSVVLMVGAPGAGKSRLARALARVHGLEVISYDDCRAELTGDEGDQSVNVAAAAVAHGRLAERCAVGRGVVVDGTHGVSSHRRSVVAIASALNRPCVAVVLATPLEVCLRRQEARPAARPGQLWGRRVPKEWVSAEHRAVSASQVEMRTEGFAAVLVVNAAADEKE